jgi:hypothetical protein
VDIVKSTTSNPLIIRGGGRKTLKNKAKNDMVEADEIDG